MRSFNIAPKRGESFQSHTGLGVEGYIGGRRVELLSQAAAQSRGLNLPPNLQKANPRSTHVFLALEGVLTGVISLSDEIRPQSYQAVNQLKKLGIQAVMLTGDNEKVAQAG